MNNDDYSIALERFLDGLMDPIEQQEFLEKYGDLDSTQEAIQIESQLNQSLERLATFGELDLSARDVIVEKAHTNAQASGSGIAENLVIYRLPIIALVVLVGVTISWFIFAGSANKAPFFEPTSLVKLHADEISKGYRPYYNCEDDQRFADVFQKRQGVPLRLTTLPSDRKMLGISYLGGFSRDTTAMLCEVKGEYVTVFVDREYNNKIPALLKSDGKLNVFQRKFRSLIFIEVSPFKEKTMIQFFDKNFIP